VPDIPDSADPKNRDREVVRAPGSIQPFGFLLAVTSGWEIVQASANLEDHLGIRHERAIGRPLSDLIGSGTLHGLRNRLAVIRGPDMAERLFGIALSEGGPPFDVTLHLGDQGILIEAEPSQAGNQGGSTMSVRSMMARLDKAASLDAFLREGARQARALTGYDRVAICRFDEAGTGEMVAEALAVGIASLLGQRFPATDAALEERALHLRNPFRIVADVDAEPVPILPEGDTQGRPLDLSVALLRAASPLHAEHLRRTGVSASLSIPLVVGGRLWGLVACHHRSPRLPSFERRSTAELFGLMFASRLESRELRLALESEKARRGKG
jgi:light-regulated signal transduction histidine kinase (bacteriophytochrome)